MIVVFGPTEHTALPFIAVCAAAGAVPLLTTVEDPSPLAPPVCRTRLGSRTLLRGSRGTDLQGASVTVGFQDYKAGSARLGGRAVVVVRNFAVAGRSGDGCRSCARCSLGYGPSSNIVSQQS